MRSSLQAPRRPSVVASSTLSRETSRMPTYGWARGTFLDARTAGGGSCPVPMIDSGVLLPIGSILRNASEFGSRSDP
jgi:hypothetical protein